MAATVVIRDRIPYIIDSFFFLWNLRTPKFFLERTDSKVRHAYLRVLDSKDNSIVDSFVFLFLISIKLNYYFYNYL